MTSLAAQFGISDDAAPLRDAFLGWQCRVRQMMMREGGGKPTDAVTPEVRLAGAAAPLGRVITVLVKNPAYSVTPELTHMAKKTPDTSSWRDEALKFFSATFYQKPHEFSEVLTSTFPPGSAGAAKMRAAQNLALRFDAYGQRYDLACRVWKLARRNPLREATMAHNRLFNPALHPDADVLGFEPDWAASAADPSPV